MTNLAWEYIKLSQRFSKWLYFEALPSVTWNIWSGGDLSDGTVPTNLPRQPYDLMPEEPQPVDVPIPPIDPINRIKLPERNPFDGFPPSTYNIIPLVVPQMPPRLLPQPPSNPTNTEKQITSEVNSSLASRKYGCLLAKPFHNLDVEWCDYVEEDPRTLFERIADSIVQFVDDVLNGVIDDLTDITCQKAIALLPLPYLTKPLLLLGCNYIDDIAKHYFQRNRRILNYPSSGLLPVGSFTITNCIIDKAPPVDGDIALLLNDNECAIPLEYYKDMEGYKGDQLQIIWRNQNWGQGNHYPKVTVLPSPRQATYYTEEMFRSVLPEWRYSGLTRVDIELQGKIPEDRIDEGEGFDEAIHGACERWKRSFNIFTGYLTKEQIEQFIETDYKEWVRQLCTEDVRYSKFVSNGYSSIEVHECWVYPYRAVLLGWDTTGKRWITKAHWYIHKKQPQTAPPDLPTV